MRWMLGIATDLDGNLYIADSGNHRVREVIATTGEIVTVAGNGSAEISGDSRPAIEAGLGYPVGVAIDAAKDIYILTASQVRKVSASDGIITTVAGGSAMGYSGDGGPALQAEINGASALALDAAGNIYISDFSNNRVRKITASTGTIDTIAGTGQPGLSGDGGSAIEAELNGPYSIAVDREGNVYIGDYFNCRVRKLSVANGQINPIAGTGACGFSGDGGPATSAEVGEVYGIAVDSQGNVYIGDSDNNRVRMIEVSHGLISTVAGNGTLGLAGDNGPAISAELESIYGLTVDQAGYLYVLNSAPGLVRAIGPGAAQNPTSYVVTLSASDPAPVMGEAVTLKAAVISNQGLPAISGTLTWFLDSVELGRSSVDGSGIASFVTTLGAAGDRKVSATYAGTPSGFGTLVLPVSGFALTGAASSSVTIPLGQSTQLVVNAAALHGFKQTVDLNCTGLPYPGVCALSEATVNFSDNMTAQNITVTLKTTSGMTTAANHKGFSARLAMIALGALTLLGIGRERRRIFVALFLLPTFLVISAAMSGCGTSSRLPASSNPTTALVTLKPGTYTVVLSASSGHETVEYPIAVTVQQAAQ